ncbi:hypothetical protein BOW53_07750 [Solemya pervernicosa gill symbiont]|uniref:Glycine zipper 2TM domain-containing protein n=2 Tax=Gammaproteobacteria incertae sedis TaxID=118884 RepID=A0A1T2L692_9GAMM|nr:glycine zipper 2TM domain-containing protein [Candidatus Reidiella endopervernicosa]OOZ40456.1 hypothetical protein BOW53_07750 [Solemya pervernicosa gill symbiont]QKQ25373.1 glycine zipper 2TM domain-containing protein [Candidatus Reidiella endopervernicosa]
MKSSHTITSALILALTAAPIYAGHGNYNDRYDRDYGRSTHKSFTDRARVIDVDPILQTVRVPTRHRHNRNCWEEEVHHSGRSDVAPGAGLIAGSIIGGVIGNQVGKGKGNKAATVFGTVVGAAVGHEMARGSDNRDDYTTTVTRCDKRRDYREREEIVGYQVRYRYNGHTFSRRMNRDPGKWVRVKVKVSPYE